MSEILYLNESDGNIQKREEHFNHQEYEENLKQKLAKIQKQEKGEKDDDNTEYILASLEDLNTSSKNQENQSSSLNSNNIEPFSYSEKGYNYYEQGDYNKAIHFFQEAIKVNNDSDILSEIYMYMGVSYNELGEYEQAIDSYKKVLEMNRNSDDITHLYGLIGTAYELQGNYNFAVKSYQEVIKKSKNKEQIRKAYVRISLIYEQQGNYDGMIESHKKAFDVMKNKEEEFNFYMSSGLNYDEKGEFDIALRFYQEVLQLEVESKHIQTAYKLIGMIYGKQGKYTEAIESYKKAIEVDETSDYISDIYMFIGIAYEGLGENTKAIESYKKALEMNVSEKLVANIYQAIGFVYIKEGNGEEALKYSQQALKMNQNPEDEGKLYHQMGLSYSSMLEKEKAFENFKTAFEISKGQIDRSREYIFTLDKLDLIFISSVNSMLDTSNNIQEIQEGYSILSEYINKMGFDKIKSLIGNKGMDTFFQRVDENFAFLFDTQGKILNKFGQADIQVGNLESAQKKYIEAHEHFENAYKIRKVRDIHINMIHNLILLSNSIQESKEQKKLGEKIMYEIQKLKQDEYGTYDVIKTTKDIDNQRYFKESNIANIDNFEKDSKTIVKGSIYSRLAKIAYENKSNIEKEINLYFGDEFKLLKSSNEGLLHSLTSDGFNGYMLEAKDGTKIFISRGTELTDLGDIEEDIKIGLGIFPGDQTQEAIDLIGSLKKGDKIVFVGHSLGGNLTQILSVMYPDNIKEGHSFNGPGAKNLKYSKIFFNPQYHEKLNNYGTNQHNKRITQNIMNYDSDDFIGKMREDIGEKFYIGNDEHGISKSNTDIVNTYIYYSNGLPMNVLNDYSKMLKLNSIYSYEDEYRAKFDK